MPLLDYEQSSRLSSMTQSDNRTGDPNSQICFALKECSLGSILVAANKIGVCTIALGNDAYTLTHDLQDHFPHAELVNDNNEFGQRVAKVIDFIEAPVIGLALPLDIRGTAFQQKVWQTLQKIPIGKQMSYTEIAQCIGKPKAMRAVANACAANILAVAIPCHRVVRSDGSLSGYRWGVERKAELLRRESSS
ncbi:AraC family transcriptional regulator of adaptative response/methylated-DNA-[protein]-cysteine methyltransferase [Nitrosomonas ureae]|uniref:AraC family transcriptional regulator of adaptative response/methylated-DNA-[protein]-cysteine methyltransferase n=2 Tax=Nitrosomonas ureae TaxID=44577 RepID=A0A2T5IP28_9PROT|nr:AraC family transcriptional regulator of adaptative response/methylated-DNA-[protein]-cysteine methyltransferase [Nitrosomonas ureae]